MSQWEDTTILWKTYNSTRDILEALDKWGRWQVAGVEVSEVLRGRGSGERLWRAAGAQRKPWSQWRRVKRIFGAREDDEQSCEHRRRERVFGRKSARWKARQGNGFPESVILIQWNAHPAGSHLATHAHLHDVRSMELRDKPLESELVGFRASSASPQNISELLRSNSTSECNTRNLLPLGKSEGLKYSYFIRNHLFQYFLHGKIRDGVMVSTGITGRASVPSLRGGHPNNSTHSVVPNGGGKMVRFSSQNLKLWFIFQGSP